MKMLPVVFISLVLISSNTFSCPVESAFWLIFGSLKWLWWDPDEVQTEANNAFILAESKKALEKTSKYFNKRYDVLAHLKKMKLCFNDIEGFNIRTLKKSAENQDETSQ